MRYETPTIGCKKIKTGSKNYQAKESNGSSKQILTATLIGNSFNLSANRINSILSELGWIKKAPVNGWIVTELGKRVGGIQYKYKNGVPYVCWPNNTIDNKILINSVNESKGDILPFCQDQLQDDSLYTKDFRDKFPPTVKAKDGHLVRSKAEAIIDNWIYEANIVHAYERKLPIEEQAYCDFWIPSGKVYIEYWGLEDRAYQIRKAKKLSTYKKHNFNLIELSDEEVLMIDDILPVKLRKYGIIPED